MDTEEFRKVMDAALDDVRTVWDQGHREYAHKDDDVFANFKRVASELNGDPMHVLWTYFLKHKDGVAAYLKGHKSQREDVRGRIKDMICYLCLLRGMIEEGEHGD